VTIATEAAEPDPDAVATPPLLMAFDLMYLAGRDLTQLPLREPRLRLEELVADSERLFPVRRLAANGLEAWEQVLKADFGGYVAEDESSVYEGGRTRCWVKVKQPG